MPTPPATPHIQRLDVLRAVAILLVVALHFYWSIRGFGTPAQMSFWDPIFAWGRNGVPLFFLISGFCIHLSFLRASSFSTPDFYWRRFARIYPAYFASLLVFTLLAIFHWYGTINFKQIITHVFLAHNFFNEPVYYGINAPFWSLAVEFQFYLLYPLLLLLRRKFGLNKILVLLFILSLGYALLCLKFPAISATVSNPTIVPDWYGWIIGACLAEAYVQERAFFPGKGWFIATSFLGMVLYDIYGGWEFLCKFAVYLFFGSLMQNYLLRRSPLALWERILVPIGLISYSIYLWHFPLITIVLRELSAFVTAPPTLLGQALIYLPLTIIVVAPISIASYLLCECRITNWLRNRKPRS